MLRYSEIPRNISGDSFTKFKEAFDEKVKITKFEHIKSYGMEHPQIDSERKVTTHSISGGPGPPTYQYYNLGNTVPACGKTQSLPSSVRNYSCAVLDVVHITPEDLANQVTLLDLPSFLLIHPDELTSCAWNKRNKLTAAPNIVTFTKRFNLVSFWTVQEILRCPVEKQRADVLGHFIKVARKLYELNNLHSLYAIISALRSASIYRLSRTWSILPKKDKQTFDRLTEVFSDKDNWSNLRKHIESLKLPCIPYLGLYLTDLIYIDMAHPHSGGLESQQRSSKINNILRIISNYQQSNYSHIKEIPHVRDYLNSIRYIEELQKFVEDDQYKLSLKLEPSMPPQSSSSCSSKESMVDVMAITSLNLSPAKASSGSLRLHSATATNKFIPGHRKCRSLGTNIFGKGVQNMTSSIDSCDIPKTLHLLDDSELEETKASPQCANVSLACPQGLLEPSRNTTEEATLLTRLGNDDILDCNNHQMNSLQGYVRRKTVLKHGRKPTVTSWQRYWIQIWSSSLAYFSPKSFKGIQRSDFKTEPNKLVSLYGCEAKLLGDESLQPDLFQLIDHQKGNVYKFRAGSYGMAEKWCQHIKHASVADEVATLPTNLMTFE